MRIALSLLFLAAPCFAQWDTNVWVGAPNRYYLDASTNKVFVKDVLQTNVESALLEREMILTNFFGGSRDYTPPSAWWRSNRAYLTDAKGYINSHCDDFVNTTYITNGTLVGYFAANATYTVPMWSSASILTEVGAPANYFTSTPWRKLTDPATSNGWHYIDDIINLLTVVPPSNAGKFTWNQARYDIVSGAEASYAAATAAADADTPSGGSSFAHLIQHNEVWKDGSDYYAAAKYDVGEYVYELGSATTNFTCESIMYGRQYVFDIYNYADEYTGSDLNSEGLDEIYTTVALVTDGSTPFTRTIMIASNKASDVINWTNSWGDASMITDGTQASWSADPTSVSDDNSDGVSSTGLGSYTQTEFVLQNFGVSNGFDYVTP